MAKEGKKYSVDDLMNVKIGDYLVLKGYPYEGIDAVSYTHLDVYKRQEQYLDFSNHFTCILQDLNQTK